MNAFLPNKWRRILAAALVCVLGVLGAVPAQAEHVRDLASVRGVRGNALIGYGLVVGLDNSGDQTMMTPFTVQSLQSMLQNLGITIPPSATASMMLTDIAAVMVTATLPAFAQPGQRIDVTVSALGTATSLRGGTLLMTPLKGVDGTVYAVAQGNVVIGGAGASQNGSKVQINQLAAGRIPEGATVERGVASPFQRGGMLALELNSTDFGTAAAVANAINAKLGAGTAAAQDGRTIDVKAPMDPNSRVDFMARVESVDVALADPPARVIINARTGSIVMNRMVTLEPAAVAHGNLSVTISTTPVVSQPGALSGGQTVVTQQSSIKVKQQGGSLMQVPQTANLSDLVNALNALGANPADLVSILQALKAAGALKADIEVI